MASHRSCGIRLGSKGSPEPVEGTCAVAELFGFHPHAVKEGKVKVTERGFLGGAEAAPGAKGALAFTSKDEGEVRFRVTVAILER